MDERPKMRSQVIQDAIQRNHDLYQTEKSQVLAIALPISKIQHFKKQKTLVQYTAVMKLCPGNLMWLSDSEDFHP